MSKWLVIAKTNEGKYGKDYVIAQFSTKAAAKKWVKSCESKQYDPYNCSPGALPRYKQSTLLANAWGVDYVQDCIQHVE